MHAFVVVRRNMSDRLNEGLQPVSFGERLAASQNFSQLFRDGMKLVEETAAYLDGPGRQESKKLDRSTSLAYATESMRLTTRLMQLASWLLLHRAVNEGEMSLAQASQEKSKGKLQERGRRLDATIHSRAAKSRNNPVERQLSLLKAAFERDA